MNVFGTTSNRHFQVWIGVNGVQDITFAYDPAALPGDPTGQDFLVGAENEAGQGDVFATLPTDGPRGRRAPIRRRVARWSTRCASAACRVGTGTVTTEMVTPGTSRV